MRKLKYILVEVMLEKWENGEIGDLEMISTICQICTNQRNEDVEIEY